MAMEVEILEQKLVGVYDTTTIAAKNQRSQRLAG